MSMEVGAKGSQKIVVTEEMTARKMGSGELAVLATPAMIAIMENTAYRSIMDWLEEDQTTVGTRMDVKHLSATPVGMEVSFETVLKGIDRKRLIFGVRAFDAAGCIGEGEHERFIVDRKQFMEKARAKSGK